ncbi:hypothetical protein E2C01_094870 [Portunus trituberculatus]|uniref:Uncharacterized protein n=1 Tax=Portunus trituberculatus TaxID=210409 RepID=A0A5B7JYS7_PORTR|nr:hypothetical protein [Portunus trituberculatus]
MSRGSRHAADYRLASHRGRRGGATRRWNLWQRVAILAAWNGARHADTYKAKRRLKICK